MIKILFVCMGNICRSPSAEGFFRHHATRQGLDHHFQIDSAGTHNYHVGHAPDERAIAEAATRDIDIHDLRARRVEKKDFHRFDYIIAMDRRNLDILQDMAPSSSRARLGLMMDHSPGGRDSEVPDPYYGGPDDFSHMCELLDEATRGLLATLSSDLNPE